MTEQELVERLAADLFSAVDDFQQFKPERGIVERYLLPIIRAHVRDERIAEHRLHCTTMKMKRFRGTGNWRIVKASEYACSKGEWDCPRVKELKKGTPTSSAADSPDASRDT